MTKDTYTRCKQDIQDALDNSDDRILFSDALAVAVSVLGLSHRQIAKDLQVSLPTVQRWIDGATAPHRLGREPVLEYLMDALEVAYVPE